MCDKSYNNMFYIFLPWHYIPQNIQYNAISSMIWTSPVDGVGKQRAGASAAGAWTYFARNIPVLTPEGWTIDRHVTNGCHIFHIWLKLLKLWLCSVYCEFILFENVLNKKHQISILLAPCKGNLPVTGGFPSQRVSDTKRMWSRHDDAVQMSNTCNSLAWRFHQ